MTTAFVYSDRFGSFSYGAEHPMRPFRLRLTRELMDSLGLSEPPGSETVEARKAIEDEILTVHTPEYLRVLKEANTGIIPVDGAPHGLGFGDNPVFKGVYDWSCYSTGASVQAADIVTSGEASVAFNIAGGLHHAMPARASGFCYLNDPAVAIKRMKKLGKRVAYVDIDAHHGDGVEYVFYESARVLTISIHESGRTLFPGTGSVTDIGMKQGKGYSLNLPLPPGTGDEEYLAFFDRLVPPAIEAFRPDVLVTQLGVDTFYTDPLTHLNLTTVGFEELVRRFRSMRLPWVALGGGGYNLSNVARAWTIAWAVMNEVPVPERIPGTFMEEYHDHFPNNLVRDTEDPGIRLRPKQVEEVDREIDYLLREVVPLIKSGD